MKKKNQINHSSQFDWLSSVVDTDDIRFALLHRAKSKYTILQYYPLGVSVLCVRGKAFLRLTSGSSTKGIPELT